MDRGAVDLGDVVRDNVRAGRWDVVRGPSAVATACATQMAWSATG